MEKLEEELGGKRDEEGIDDDQRSTSSTNVTIEILSSKDAKDVKSKAKTTKTKDARICKDSRTKTTDDVLQRIEAQVVKISKDLKIRKTDDVLQRIETQVVEISKTLKAKKTDDVLGTISRLENETATTRKQLNEALSEINVLKEKLSKE